VRATAAPDPNGTRPASGTAADGPVAAEIAALTTRLIGLTQPAGLSESDLAELDAAVAAQVAAGLTLRRYPLANGDEPMLVNDPRPGLGGPR
jgi:hypothetical protein